MSQIASASDIYRYTARRIFDDVTERLRARFDVRNGDRSIGAMLSGELARRFGGEGLPNDSVRFHFVGSAGQSFGAFGMRGLTLALEGEANDHVGKGLSGARLVVALPRERRARDEFDVTPFEDLLAGR